MRYALIHDIFNEKITDRQEVWKRLAEAFPYDERAVTVLNRVLVYDQTYTEIAKDLKLSVSRVSQIANRAMIEISPNAEQDGAAGIRFTNRPSRQDPEYYKP